RERRGDGPANGVLEVGIVTDDERVLPAELEARLREAARGHLVDRPTGRGRAREADEVDAGVRYQWRPGFPAEPVHDVEHTGRDTRLERELAEQRRGRRRVLG